jgi:hypothetical protein
MAADPRLVPTGVRGQLTASEARGLGAVGERAGVPKRIATNSFMKAELASSSEEPVSPPIRQPLWLRALAKKKVPIEELGKQLASRIKRNPDSEQVVLTQAIINEIGRGPTGAKFVRAASRHPLVGAVMNKRR